MTLPIVETRAITGGVDTHADVHVAAALDPIGGLLGVAEFPATPAGYARLLAWLGGFGTLCLVGIEGTGSYGAGLARHIAAAGVQVVEVDRSDRQDRRRQGKSDPLDAVSAARAAQSGRARGAPKGRDGQVEAIRTLMVTKRTARSERVQTINQARALVLTGPDDIRVRFAKHATDALVAELASLRPRPGDTVGYATRIALRELGRRVQFLDSQLQRLDELIVPLVTARAPGLLTLYGVGPDTAAMLLVAAGDHPGRLRSEAAWAHLCATAPIPASSGKTVRHRLNPRRRPAGQPCPVADRDHPDELPPADPRLRHAPHQRRPVQEGDHPLPQALRRPRGLSPPAPARRLTLTLRGRPGPIFGCRTPAGLLTIRRPPPGPLDLLGVTS
jgi:transposase